MYLLAANSWSRDSSPVSILSALTVRSFAGVTTPRILSIPIDLRTVGAVSYTHLTLPTKA